MLMDKGLQTGGATVDLAAMHAWWITVAFWLRPPEGRIFHVPSSFCISSTLESSTELLTEKQVARDLCNMFATATVQREKLNAQWSPHKTITSVITAG